MASSNQTGEETFGYNPLDLSRESIRLIRLQNGLPGDPIACDLLEVLLNDEGVPYSALSYTWGDASDTRRIHLDGVPFKVTSNLYQALYNLRRPAEDRYLWVDALCIDQNNVDERNHQVGQMRRVYQHAEHVIIWLGESTSDIDELLDLVNDLDRRLLEDKAPMKLLWVARARLLWDSMIRSSVRDKEDFNKRSRYAMATLLARPWFNRIWVVQEAASAKVATIACGHKSTPTRTFALTPGILGITPGERAAVLLELMPGPLRRHSWWNEKPNLETLLRKFHSCDATDPRDKIYALLGIASDTTENEAALKANYQLGIQEALLETVSFLIFGKVIDLTFLEIPHHVLDLVTIVGLNGDVNTAKSRFQGWIDVPQNFRRSRPRGSEIQQRSTHITSPFWEGISLPPSVNIQDFGDFLHNPDRNSPDTTQKASQLLFQAAAHGQAGVVTSLLAKFGKDITMKRVDQISALGLAAKAGHLSCVHAIIPFDDALSYRDERSWGHHPLNLAAKHGHTEVLRILIASSSPGHAPIKNTYERLLAEATRYDYSTPVVNLLVDTLVSQLDDSQPLDGFCFRYTLVLHTFLLHSAIRHQKKLLAWLLLDMGARMNEDDGKETAASLEVKHKRRSLIIRLRQLLETRDEDYWASMLWNELRRQKRELYRQERGLYSWEDELHWMEHMFRQLEEPAGRQDVYALGNYYW